MFKYLVLLTILSFSAMAKWTYMLESGLSYQQRNDVQIPNDTGTRLEFDRFDHGPFFHYRAELDYEMTNNHNLRLVLAPFDISVSGFVADSVDFDGTTFAGGQDLSVDYRFNSYRLGYYYSFWGRGKRQLNFGVTGKIRDARIRFRQASLSETYDNLGFVPLLYFAYQEDLGSGYYFNLNTDAAAAPQGRAIDLALKLRKDFSSHYQWGLGVRSLEGGADNDKLFTFSWVNYIVLDISGSF